MINYFVNLDPYIQALYAGLFTFFITVLGSSVVFFFKDMNKNIMDGMLAISAGIMLAAAFFSLLNPAIDIANKLKMVTPLIILIGFLLGGVVLHLGDKAYDLLFKSKYVLYKFKRSIMLFISITLHNIPEGLVIGVAFGAVVYNLDNATLLSAIFLTIAIAIQNFPEGSAISLPLRRDGVSRLNAFLFGAFSAIVEPIFAVIGALLVMKVQIILPIVMSFTAGAMVFVVTLELIPESQNNTKKGLMALLLMLGFSIMMILELIF